MAHFSKLDENNIVETVVVVNDEFAPTEAEGIQWLKDFYNEPHSVWVQTSYNTIGNTHILGGTPLRKNYGAKGFKYISRIDAFVPEQPYPSWTLNEETALWECPVERPDREDVIWNEENQTWDIVTYE